MDLARIYRDVGFPACKSRPALDELMADRNQRKVDVHSLLEVRSIFAQHIHPADAH